MRDVWKQKKDNRVRLCLKSEAGVDTQIKYSGGNSLGMEFSNAESLYISYAGSTGYIDASQLDSDGLIVEKWSAK